MLMGVFMENISFFGVSLIQIVWSIAFIIAGIILWKFISGTKEKVIARVTSGEHDVKKQATVGTIYNGVRIAIAGLVLLVVLQINGINVNSIIASLGIAGAVAGLAWQDLFKDIIQGVRIMSDNMFKVGDYIAYNNAEYQVIEFTTRTTRMKRIDTGDILIVCNRDITSVTQLSGKAILSISLPYEVDSERIDQVLSQCAQEIGKIKGVSDCSYLGLKSFEESSVDYLLTFNCSPSQKHAKYRAALRVIRDILCKEKIEIPYNKLDIYEK